VQAAPVAQVKAHAPPGQLTVQSAPAAQLAEQVPPEQFCTQSAPPAQLKAHPPPGQFCRHAVPPRQAHVSSVHASRPGGREVGVDELGPAGSAPVRPRTGAARVRSGAASPPMLAARASAQSPSLTASTA
jgi:hypothetical protein